MSTGGTSGSACWRSPSGTSPESRRRKASSWGRWVTTKQHSRSQHRKCRFMGDLLRSSLFGPFRSSSSWRRPCWTTFLTGTSFRPMTCPPYRCPSHLRTSREDTSMETVPARSCRVCLSVHLPVFFPIEVVLLVPSLNSLFFCLCGPLNFWISPVLYMCVSLCLYVCVCVFVQGPIASLMQSLMMVW